MLTRPRVSESSIQSVLQIVLQSWTTLDVIDLLILSLVNAKKNKIVR